MIETHWRELERQHEARADSLTAAHRARVKRREKHPVEDFLFTYYPVSPAQLRRWHPGAGVVLEGAARPDGYGAEPDRASWKYYAPRGEHGLEVDAAAYFARRASAVDFIEGLLRATLERTPAYGCFGLHEWAMVYRLDAEQLRHTSLPLRLSHAETDAIVESNPITCTHFDAFRFFTPEAAPLNTLQPSRETQPDLEQAGCLHAGMDVYKWASKLGPLIPGELLLDTFELARDIREVDMMASPYDVTGFTASDGTPLGAIPIETPAGKQHYARLQRGFAERGNSLRDRVLDAIASARDLALETAGRRSA